MEAKNCQNVFKICKVFSVLMVVITILWLFFAFILLLSPEQVKEVAKEESITNLGPLYETLTIYSLIALYFLIGGIGLLKLKSWSAKMIYSLGLILFVSRVVELLYYRNFDFELILILILGVFSSWLYKNRSCFVSKSKQTANS